MLSLSPVRGGEGWGEGPLLDARKSPHRPSPNLSPEYGGEGQEESARLAERLVVARPPRVVVGVFVMIGDGDLVFAVEPAAEVHQLATFGAEGIRVRAVRAFICDRTFADRTFHNACGAISQLYLPFFVGFDSGFAV